MQKTGTYGRITKYADMCLYADFRRPLGLVERVDTCFGILGVWGGIPSALAVRTNN